MKKKGKILVSKKEPQPVAFLDNAATSQKPTPVIDAVSSIIGNRTPMCTEDVNCEGWLYHHSRKVISEYCASEKKLFL